MYIHQCKCSYISVSVQMSRKKRGMSGEHKEKRRKTYAE